MNIAGCQCDSDFTQNQWTIPQLDKVLNSKTILAQLERAS